MLYYAAPMEGFTDRVWRQTHQKWFGAKGAADRYYAPFISPPENRVLIKKKMAELAPAANPGAPVIPQLLAKDGELAAWMIGQLRALGYTEVNLNLGCPAGTVTAKGKGSGFLAHPDELAAFFDEVFSDAAVRNGEFLVSVKTRIGKNEVEEWPELMQVYNRYPIHELTVHPRIQKEFYKGTPHLDVFADILKESRNPVVYNGDLFTVEKVKEFREKFPTVGTVMIGRGLIRNPALAEMILQEETEACTDRLENGVRIFEADGQLQTQGNRNKGDILPRIREFHDALFEHYRETMSGDRNLLFRMKDLWSYMLAEVPDSEKLAKKIRKSQHVPEYLAAVEEVFARWDANR